MVFNPADRVAFHLIGFTTIALIRDHVFTDPYFAYPFVHGTGASICIHAIHLITQVLLLNVVCLLNCIWTVMFEAPLDGGWDWDWYSNDLVHHNNPHPPNQPHHLHFAMGAEADAVAEDLLFDQILFAEIAILEAIGEEILNDDEVPIFPPAEQHMVRVMGGGTVSNSTRNRIPWHNGSGDFKAGLVAINQVA